MQSLQILIHNKRMTFIGHNIPLLNFIPATHVWKKDISSKITSGTCADLCTFHSFCLMLKDNFPKQITLNWAGKLQNGSKHLAIKINSKSNFRMVSYVKVRRILLFLLGVLMHVPSLDTLLFTLMSISTKQMVLFCIPIFD